MNKEMIRKHFKNAGYEVTTCVSGNVVITKKSGYGKGFDKTFSSLSAAHKHYFNY